MFIQARSELEAINTILAMVGESPVNSTALDAIAPGAIARNILREVSRSVQAKGWYFNTEERYVLTPDNTGRIYVPINTMDVEAVDERQVGQETVVVRNNHLYSMTRHTDVFPQPITVNLILALEFQDLPQSAREYITILAGMRFASRYTQDEMVFRFSEVEVNEAKATLISEDLRSRPQYFGQNAGVLEWTRWRAF